MSNLRHILNDDDEQNAPGAPEQSAPKVTRQRASIPPQIRNKKLKDSEWTSCVALMPEDLDQQQLIDARRTLEAILAMLRVRIKWIDLPEEEYGKQNTNRIRAGRWRDSGLLEKLLNHLRGLGLDTDWVRTSLPEPRKRTPRKSSQSPSADAQSGGDNEGSSED